MTVTSLVKMASNVLDSHAEAEEKDEKEEIKMEEDKDNSEDDSDESSEADDDEKETELKQNCDALAQKVNENPYMYDYHCELITSLQQLGDLEKLRNARQRMSEIFPLTEDLWLAWLKDEINIATDEEGRQLVTDLFERAVKDYLSIPVWLEYVQFSIGGMGQVDGIKRVREMFDKALTHCGLHVTKAIPVWLEYVQFSIGGMGQVDGIKRVREVFDKALTHCGLHVAKGATLWEAYREFESAILAGLLPEPGGVPSKEEEEKFSEQHDRVNNLFKRQLTVPLFDLEETMSEYKSWLQEEPDKFTKQVFNKALIKLEKIQPYEDSLLTAEAPRLEEYKEYLKFEQKEGDPSRIQCLYERAIQENCLNTDMWLQYTKYLDHSLKVPSISVPVYERAVRNCPWCVQIWQNYMLCLERGDYPYEKVKDVWETALVTLSQPSEYLLVYTTFLDYLKRRIKWNEEHTEDLETFQYFIGKALEVFDDMGNEGDQNGTIRQFWAVVEAKYCKNLPRARELWQEIMTVGRANEAALWMEFYRFERIYGDAKHCRRVLQRALNSVTDWPESVVDAYINFEREEGTLEQYDQAVSKCEAQMARITERREKSEQDQATQDTKKKPDKKGNKWNKPQQNKHKDQKKFQKQNKLRADESHKSFNEQEENERLEATSPEVKPYKRKHTETTENEADNFKVPVGAPLKSPKSAPPPGYKQQKSKAPPPGYTPPSSDTSTNGSSGAEFKAPVAPPPGYKGGDGDKTAETTAEPPTKKLKTEGTELHDGSAGDRTAFVSNLLFEVGEDKLQDFFKKCGLIEEIRLVKNAKGRSKGYAYIQFEDQLAVANALSYDRELMEGRPMYVSKYEHRTHKTKADFKYKTGLEKSKLFIKNLPHTCTKSALETLFGQHGEVKDVRLVTYKNGAPKGMAYVEYADEQSATQAVMKTDGVQIGDNTISVAISNPPTRNKPVGDRDEFVPSLGMGKKDTDSRGKARTQVSLMPRSLTQKCPQKSKPSTAKPEEKSGDSEAMDTTDTSSKPAGLSNSDFRNLLLKK